jgi:hypothetical protein
MDLKSAGRKAVGVQVPLRAPIRINYLQEAIIHNKVSETGAEIKTTRIQPNTSGTHLRPLDSFHRIREKRFNQTALSSSMASIHN